MSKNPIISFKSLTWFIIINMQLQWLNLSFHICLDADIVKSIKIIDKYISMIRCKILY